MPDETRAREPSSHDLRATGIPSRTLALSIARLVFALCCIVAAAAAAADSMPASADELPMPSWFEGGKPAADAQTALDILLNAADQGLEREDYHAVDLAQAFQEATRQPADPIRDAGLDAALTDAFASYLQNLHQGRTPAPILARQFGIHVSGQFDARGLIRQARQRGALAQIPAEVQPRWPQYEPLRQAMNAYRAMGRADAWRMPLPTTVARTVRPGDAYAGLAILTQRLEVLGDLAAEVPAPARYEGALVEAVKHFQARHGLDPDGLLGAATLAQVNVSPTQRVRQMVLALERLRWAPLPDAPRVVEVNIPEFRLRAYEIQAGHPQQVLSMRVIVGKALDTRTPLIREAMRSIEFSPYWNVPRSIARGETLPKLRRDPDYFTQQGFEFVTGDGTVVRSLSNEAIDAVQRGDWRIRQRPGPQNALGDIKFIFPNAQNIYLHHTPAPLLFGHTRRDFSHGCIRIEAPFALAAFVLQDDPQWTQARITQAAASGRSRLVSLPRPVPVILTYRTTAIGDDGTVQFFPDIYQQDARLAQALGLR